MDEGEDGEESGTSGRLDIADLGVARTDVGAVAGAHASDCALDQISRFMTFSALLSMKSRRGSTTSPIKVLKI